MISNRMRLILMFIACLVPCLLLLGANAAIGVPASRRGGTLFSSDRKGDRVGRRAAGLGVRPAFPLSVVAQAASSPRPEPWTGGSGSFAAGTLPDQNPA